MQQFILTGSSTPLDEDSEMEHTGLGRIARLRMRPMSLWESKESAGQVSLQALFDGTQQMGLFENPLTIKDLAYVMCRGGWPGALQLDKEEALDVAYNYLDELIQVDVNKVDGSEKNPDRVRSVLRSYARNISTMTTATTIMNDGRWAAVEVKTGSKEIEDAAANLIELTKQVDTSKIGEPAFLMVLTGGELAYRREDGVYVVPIGCLKP